MANLSEVFGSTIKSKVFGEMSTKKVEPTKENPNLLLKVIGKNFMSMAGIARDLNVARQATQKLVKVEGGEPAKGADAHFLKSAEREKKLEVEMGEKKDISKPKKPTQVKDKVKKLKDQFSQSNILKSLTKYFAIGAVITVIFVAFKDTLVEWVGSLWDTIKEKFGEFVENIKQWFNDVVQPIIDAVKEFIQPVVDAVSNVFKSIGDWFVEKFNAIKEIAEGPFNFIKKIIDKVLDTISSLVDKLPDWIKDKLGIKKKVEAPKGPDQTENEVRKLKRQQEEVAETERVKKLEKEKQYTGTDEIVRERLGLPPKTETMRREEEAKKKVPVETAPAPQPIIVPGPLPKAAEPPPPTAPAKAPPKAAPPAAPSAAAPAPGAKPPTAAEAKPGKLSSKAGKDAMLNALNQAKVTDPTARAQIMAQVGHESGNFTTLSENLNYKPQTLLKIFPKYFKTPEDAQQTASAGPEAIANRVYGGRMGNAPDEGFKYRGRGFIQLTGKDNYKRFGYASNPDDVSKPEAAADTAIKFMMGYKGDWGDVKKVTKFVNGGYIGLEDRVKHFQEYLNDPTITKVGAVASTPSGGGVSSASTELASGQREQQKPTTPVVINAPTTNNQTVTQNQVQPKKQEYVGNAVAARVA